MDGSNDMISITVLIAGRPYPLKIKTGDEPAIRKVVKEINDQINRFQIAYTTKDKQDCLAMVALTYAVDAQKSQTGSSEIATPSPDILDRLSHLNQLLDQALQS